MSNASRLEQAYRHFAEGNLAEAEKLCRKILNADPGAHTAFHLCASIHQRRGALEKALADARSAVKLAPAQPRYHGTLGEIYAAMGKEEAAEKAFRHLLDVDPDNSAALVAIGNLHFHKERLEEAESQYLAAREKDPSLVTAHYSLGLVYGKQGKVADALAAYATCLQLNPDFVQARVNAANIQLSQGRFELAVAEYETVLRSYPEWPMVLNNLGMARRRLGMELEAAQAFAKSLALEPNDLETRANLADLLVKNERPVEAEKMLEEGRKIAPDNARFQLILGRIDNRRGDLEKAKKRLSAIKPETLSDTLAGELHHERGLVLDALGETDAAFEQFTSSNRHLRAEAQSMGIDKSSYRDYLRRMADTLDKLNPASGKVGLQPVYLVGFPGSGGARLKELLERHPDVRVLTDQFQVEHLKARAEERLGRLPENLIELSDEDLHALREDYRRLVQPGAGEIVVDTFPLNSAELPFILQLFPGARFIFLQRHPQEVCLDCFMRAFGANAATANFFTLEDSAQLYSQVMELWESGRERLNPQVLQLRQEDLASDPVSETQRVLEFLGLNRPPNLDEAPASPTEPTRRHGYSAQLAGITDSLQPWLDRYGYQA